MIQVDEWHNCYDGSWSGILTPAAFAHPAKYATGLISRIISHAIEDGLVKAGDTILDPFGGVACGAWPCLRYGLHWVGVELESKFVELGQENINLWNERYAAHFPNWGSAQIYQGDSRRLAQVVASAGLVVSSPPYAESLRGDNKPDYDRDKIEAAKESGATAERSTWGVTNSVGVLTGKGYGSTEGNLGNLPPGDIQAVISSPPFAGTTGGRGEASRNGIDPGLFDRHSGGMKKGTGDDPANLDHLPMGRIEAVISSPPYVDSMETSGGIDPGKSNHIGGPHSQMNRSDTRYGETDGQLGAMPAGTAVIASPPFENSTLTTDEKFMAQVARDKRNGSRLQPGPGTYGSTNGQIGATQGDNFWSAARLIVEQCATILPPNGSAIWVVKNYVKGGKVVEFSEQWRQLCEACGFETVHEHRAMLVKEHAAQKFMLGGIWMTNKVQKKSFFRRLAEKNGAPPIDFESVLCMQKAA